MNQGHLEISELLLEHGAAVDVKSNVRTLCDEIRMFDRLDFRIGTTLIEGWFGFGFGFGFGFQNRYY